MKHSHPNPSRIVNLLEILLLLIAAVFLALHALYLRADFPNHSPWMDWAKYTDEGWYGDAAIRHFQRGHWYVPGDFNPAAALPVLPLLEAVLFRFTGVSLAAARGFAVGLFALILVCSYLLLRRWPSRTDSAMPRLAPAIAVLLLAVSPFCYAFTRLAILEPLLILLTLLALLVASYATPKQETGLSSRDSLLRHAVPILALGLLLPLMVLTKTTALFLMPSIAWILWARAEYRLRPFLRMALPVAALASVVWISFYGFIVRPHFLDDFHYLFSANAYTGITPDTALKVLFETFRDGLWIGSILYPLALFAAVSALLLYPRLLRNPLIPSLLLWAAGYAAFLAYHDNLQPRYYLVIAVPLTLLVPAVLESLWAVPSGHSFTPLRRAAIAVAVLVLAVLAFTDARRTIHYVRTPEYTFLSAANRIRSIVTADPTHNPLILSISGSTLSLMTGLPSICDDFGTMELPDRVRAYRPGWYAAWNQVDDDKMEALAPIYNLHRVASFPAMDDPDRNLLILYRLDPPVAGAHPHHTRRRVIPRSLLTSFGQQPSPTQLEH
jgi:hypothetical protein